MPTATHSLRIRSSQLEIRPRSQPSAQQRHDERNATAKSRFAFWTVQTQHATYRGRRHTGQIAPWHKRRTENNVSAAFKVPRKGPVMLPFPSRGVLCSPECFFFFCLELFLQPRNEPRTMTLDHRIVLSSAGGVWDAILFLRRYGAGILHNLLIDSNASILVHTYSVI